ncbi:ArsR family transcriptional regulator [Brevibacillus formosus]|uniref:Transcriptional regulator n=1 Tax=Brevibacillus formosus TaxID=54913 RepID=A0ABQ0TDM0_9BACL|nr:ArsR family transcriptional regulator [Brevibacillus formosus]MED1957078.1 ArsR family transcriptional regulator [Brevibacillus formosus]GED61398.1 transcriptional regulator [Brevibacillus formosus]
MKEGILLKLRLGVIGADDSLAIIESVMREFPEIEYLPIVYWKEEEILDLILPHVDEVDMWLFSGQVPYAMVSESGKVQVPMAYVPHLGASLYRTLLHLSHQLGVRVEEVSFDTFSPEELGHFLDEAGIAGGYKWLKHYEGAISADELADYHEQLWKAGKTKVAVTCLRTADVELVRRGVPVHRVVPTRAGVISVIHMLLRTHEMLHFKDTQIAVQMMEIDPFRELAGGNFSTDEWQNAEIKTMEKLLRYAKHLQGSLKTAGPGRYVIFTTRGNLQEVTRDYATMPDLEELFGIRADQVTCGIGIGKTAYEAEIHGGAALLHAKERGTGNWMVFFDDKSVVGPLGRAEQITYRYDSEKLQELSQLTSLSVMTLAKLYSILKKRGSQEIHATELASYLQILPRSARRILIELESKGLAQVIREENPHPRGRPRKVYRIEWQSQL